jgi:hypothetical protein
MIVKDGGIAGFPQSTMRMGLIRAVLCNERRSACLRIIGGELLNEKDKNRLNYYAARNESLSQWDAAPVTGVEREAWPKLHCAHTQEFR